MLLGLEPLNDGPISTGPSNTAVGYALSDALINWQFFIYAATVELISGPSDQPASQAYIGTMEDSLRITRSIVGGDRVGEAITIGLGEIRLVNLDRDYDGLAIDTTAIGQIFLVRMGDPRRHFTDGWVTALRGYLTGFTLDRDAVTFSLRDAGHRLDVPLSANVYGGTGGADGSADLKGKRKPLSFGVLRNVKLDLVIPSALAYQAHDGKIDAVTAVRARGAAQSFSADYATVAALTAASLSVGQYATCLAEGWVRIAVAGGSEVGEVTCDLRGDASGGSFVSTTADIVRRILARATDFADPAELVTASFDALNAAQPAVIGYGVRAGSDETVAQAIGKIMGGIGGWGGTLRDERYGVWRFDEPAGVPTALYDETMLMAPPQLGRLPDVLSPPPWRVLVAHNRNWYVQSTDLAGSVSDSDRAFLAEEVRYAEAKDNNIRLDFPPGHDLICDGYFAFEPDAIVEAARRLALWGTTPRELYVIALAQPIYAHELGETIGLIFPGLGLDEGKLLRVVTIELDGRDGVKLTVVG